MKLRFVDIFGFGRKSTFWAFQLLVLLFRLHNPRKLFSWQTLHDPANNEALLGGDLYVPVWISNLSTPQFRKVHMSMSEYNVSVSRLSAHLAENQYHYSMRKFADFSLYILKCRVGPSFIHLVMSAMFIWTYSYISYSSNSIFFCLICLRDTEAWILELSISIFFENF